MPHNLSRSDELILLAVWKLGDDAYGASILDFLQEETLRAWSIAGVYAPLKRMAGDGLLRSRTGRPTPQRGGRRKRVYELTASGIRALQTSRAEYESMWAGVGLTNDPAVGVAS